MAAQLNCGRRGLTKSDGDSSVEQGNCSKKDLGVEEDDDSEVKIRFNETLY